MTINGPAPTILAFFLNTAIDQDVEAWAEENGRRPRREEAHAVRAQALQVVRGTVQADILKEDQGQNTCLFSTEFSLRMMGDIQEWFIEQGVRNFYSVSISGYHIAEAGANPISQLAFTLANGFTYVEAYLARGMAVDDFAPNLSFFFSNGMDPEYTVIGRVARRIWAIAMSERYGADERSQKLKYHVQTSGRSLHAQEMDFNDIRTTLQALFAIYDNANSLHTNAYDEAVTTPGEESVRRALAIQLIINKEWGLAMNENPLQGSFVVDELTDLVEAAVLAEFDRISERGGVLGAMETGYQRGRIQDESMLYEHRKHDGSLPIVGVNTFRNPRADEEPKEVVLARASEAEKESQLERVTSLPRGAPRGGRAGARPPQGGGDVRGERLRRPHGAVTGVLAPAGHRGVLRGGRAVPPQRLSAAVRSRRLVEASAHHPAAQGGLGDDLEAGVEEDLEEADRRLVPDDRLPGGGLGRVPLEDPGADLSAVLDGGVGELVHQPLAAELLADDEAGHRPDPGHLGVHPHPRLPAGPDPRVALARLDRDPAGGLAVDVADEAGRRSVGPAGGLLQQGGVSLLLRGVAPDPARDLQRLAAALPRTPGLEDRLDVVGGRGAGRPPGELGHGATLAAGPDGGGAETRVPVVGGPT